MARNVKKRTFEHVCPAKIQVGLRICAVWSKPLLGACLVTKDAKFLHADNEDSDPTARMRRRNWVFVGGTISPVAAQTESMVISSCEVGHISYIYKVSAEHVHAFLFNGISLQYH